MPTTSDTNPVPQTGFDPVAFWIAHKTKVIIYGSILVIALLAYAYYEISTQTKLAEARQALAQAGSEDDYRQIIQKFPHTVAAGNASLLLAEKLRAEKKYPDAIAVLQAEIADNPNYPMIDGVWFSLANTYNEQGNQSQAIETYQQVAKNYADRYSAPQALLAVADILKAENKLDDAKTAYETVKSQFPNSLFANEALRKLQLLKK